MRWLGQMQRAFDLMCERALSREAFGSALAEKQTVPELDRRFGRRDPGLPAAHAPGRASPRRGDEARVEISLVKFYAARVLHDVIDRAIQVHGRPWDHRRDPLAQMYLRARASRFIDGPDESIAWWSAATSCAPTAPGASGIRVGDGSDDDDRERLGWDVTPELYARIRRLWIDHSKAEDSRDLAGLIATLSEDCVYEIVPTGERWEGQPGARAFYTSFLRHSLTCGSISGRS